MLRKTVDRGKNRYTTFCCVTRTSAEINWRSDHWQQTCYIAEHLPPNFLHVVRRDSHSHSLCVSRRVSEASEPADVMDAAGAAVAAVAAVEEEPKAAPQVCLLCLRVTRSGFTGSMSVHPPLVSAVLFQQQQIETIQQTIQSIGRVTRSVAANSPKLAPPSLFSIDKTPNKKTGNLKNYFVGEQTSSSSVFLVGPPEKNMKAPAI